MTHVSSLLRELTCPPIDIKPFISITLGPSDEDPLQLHERIGWSGLWRYGKDAGGMERKLTGWKVRWRYGRRVSGTERALALWKWRSQMGGETGRQSWITIELSFDGHSVV